MINNNLTLFPLPKAPLLSLLVNCREDDSGDFCFSAPIIEIRREGHLLLRLEDQTTGYTDDWVNFYFEENGQAVFALADEKISFFPSWRRTEYPSPGWDELGISVARLAQLLDWLMNCSCLDAVAGEEILIQKFRAQEVHCQDLTIGTSIAA